MISFTIEGEPVPKGRPRARIIGRPPHQQVQIYTPPETAAAEQAFALQAKKYRPRVPIWGPLVVELVFVVSPPQKIPDDRSRVWPHVKPDVDNYAKLVMDALNEMMWHDDGQVCSVVARKVYGHPARTVVRIRPLTLEDYEQLADEIGETVAQRGIFGGENG